MEVKILNVNEKGDMLEFEIHNTDVSVVNSLRRVVLTQIPMLVFRGFPHKENQLTFHKNKTKFNNEYLKHRIQCIPVYESDESKFENFVQNYCVKVNVKNDTNELRYVTTKDFKLFNKVSGKQIDIAESKRLFPQNPLSADHIPICVLMPKISETDEAEEISLTLNFMIGTSKEDACWNTVSKCCYFNKEDEQEVKKVSKGVKPEDLDDFLILDAQRIYVPNQFIFKINSIGVFENKEIIVKASQYIIDGLTDFKNFLIHKTKLSVETIGPAEPFGIFKDETSDKETYYVRLDQDDYTIGKLLENHLNLWYKKDIYYISFKKDHPHDTHCYVSFAYRNVVTFETIIGHLDDVVTRIIQMYETISGNFTNK